MDKLMQVFQYNGAQVRVSTLNGEPAFVANDVCAILAVDPTQTRRLDPDEKGLCSIQTPGGEQQMLVVTESGLYTLVLGSRKPEARAFKRWVTHDVLPQIRKTGAYSIKALPQTYAQALRELADTVEQKALLEAKIEQDAPKVEFFDAVADAEGLHDIGTVAKMLGWGRNNLFAHLRKMRILMSNNMPMQKFVNRGYFVVREKLIDMGGSAVVKPQTYVTGKGLQWLQEKIVPPYEGRKKPHLSGKAKIEGHWRHPLAGNRQEIGG